MRRLGILLFASIAVALYSVSIAAQWPKITEPGVPRDEKGAVRADAPTPRTADGKPDLSGMWMRANSGPPNAGRGRQGGAPGGAGGGANPNGFFGGRGGFQLESPTAPFPFDPTGPPVAGFGDAGGNIDGG